MISISSNKSILFVSIPLLVLLFVVSLFILHDDGVNEAGLANNIEPNNLFIVSDNITLSRLKLYEVQGKVMAR